jgi:hypothetical protein
MDQAETETAPPVLIEALVYLSRVGAQVGRKKAARLESSQLETVQQAEGARDA